MFMKKKKEVLSENHPIIKKRIKKSLDVSIKEGSFAAVTNSFGNSYFSPYALALNATSSQIGILSGLSSLLPGIIQLHSSKLVEKYSRKKIAMLAAFFQALMLLPIIALAYFFYVGYDVSWFLIGAIALFYCAGAVIHPVWFSWMGSLVAKEERGRYFSKRNKISGFFGLTTMILAALILDFSRTLGLVLVGFGILFLTASIFRFITVFLFKQQYEPHLKVRKKDYFSFWQFLKKAPYTPFGVFTIFTAFMMFAKNIAGPFFAVYMLKDLGFSYIWFMAITVSGTVFQLVFYPLLGKYSDNFGNVSLLRVACFSLILTPLLWLVSANPLYLMIVPGLVGGFAWAGFHLATNNYIYDSVSQEKRTFGLSYHNLLVGVGLFTGASLGSFLIFLDVSFMNSILFVFLVSVFVRVLVVFVGIRYLKEVRHVDHFTKQFIIREFTPVRGIIREIHRLTPRGKIVHHVD